MQCLQPHDGWQSKTTGGVLIGQANAPRHHQRDRWQYIPLPCGQCLPCRTNHAKGLALRCQLESMDHDTSLFTTWTYDDAHLPPTLEKRAYQLALKRLRKAQLSGQHRPATAQPIRYFISGEYGETNFRPHYHAILFGANDSHRDIIAAAWPNGFTYTVALTHEAISYVAGYTSKKLNDAEHSAHERIDPHTGEVYTWQPPFTKWSQGLGGTAKQHVHSWRDYAVKDGNKMQVPRYLHEAWRAQATENEKIQLKLQKMERNRDKILTTYELEALREISERTRSINADKRKL